MLKLNLTQTRTQVNNIWMKTLVIMNILSKHEHIMLNITRPLDRSLFIYCSVIVS